MLFQQEAFPAIHPVIMSLIKKDLLLILVTVVVIAPTQLLAQSAASNGGMDSGGAHAGHNMSQAPSPTDSAAKYNAENVRYKPIATKTVIRPRTAKDLEDMRNATMKFRLESATNGLPSSQYAVGMSYLKGSDGFQTNYALATYWLKAAAAQGNQDAKAVLQKIPMKEAEAANAKKGAAERPVSVEGCGQVGIP